MGDERAVTSPSMHSTSAGLVGDTPLREGFVSGFLLIFFSEIGDKTFFIALLLALKQSKAAVFTGTFGALAIMTVISVALGQTLHQLDELVPKASEAAVSIPYDDLIAAALLVWFGIQTIKVWMVSEYINTKACIITDLWLFPHQDANRCSDTI